MRRREYIVGMLVEPEQPNKEDAITPLVGQPGPTPNSAVRMNILREYTKVFYPGGELPLALKELEKLSWEPIRQSNHRGLLQIFRRGR